MTKAGSYHNFLRPFEKSLLDMGGLKFSKIKGQFPLSYDAEKESLRKETCAFQTGMNSGDEIHGCNTDSPTVRALRSARELLKFISWEGD